MLAAHDKNIDNVAQELYKANADDRIRRECEAREEFYFEQRRQQQKLDALKRENSAKDQTISSQAAEIARLREKLSTLGLDDE